MPHAPKSVKSCRRPAHGHWQITPANASDNVQVAILYLQMFVCNPLSSIYRVLFHYGTGLCSMGDGGLFEDIAALPVIIHRTAFRHIPQPFCHSEFVTPHSDLSLPCIRGSTGIYPPTGPDHQISLTQITITNRQKKNSLITNILHITILRVWTGIFMLHCDHAENVSRARYIVSDQSRIFYLSHCTYLDPRQTIVYPI